MAERKPKQYRYGIERFARTPTGEALTETWGRRGWLLQAVIELPTRNANREYQYDYIFVKELDSDDTRDNIQTP